MLYQMQVTHGGPQDGPDRGKLSCGVAIVDACHTFFNDNPHYFFCVVDGLIQREYLSVDAFAEWVVTRDTEVLVQQYHLLEYLHVSMERVVTGQYTRNASTAANMPKPEIDVMDSLVQEEDRRNNVYRAFAAMKRAGEMAMTKMQDGVDGGEEMVRMHGERTRALREHGNAMATMARCAIQDSVDVAHWDLEKISVA